MHEAWAPTSGHDEPLMRKKLRRAMDESAARVVRFVLPALALFFGLLAPFHLLMLPAPYGLRMGCVAAAAALLLSLEAWRHRRQKFAGTAHRFVLAGIGAVYVNAVLHFYWLGDEFQTVNLLLLILLSGLVVLRTRVLVATVLGVLLTWAALFQISHSPHLSRWAFGMVTAALLAFAHHYILTSNLRQIETLRLQSDALLLNVMPESIATRLKAGEAPISDKFARATVLFADIVGFTTIARGLEPSRLVTILDGIFAGFDSLAARHGVEKIKTIGDSYMAVAGCPVESEDHAERVAAMALDLQQLSAQLRWDDGKPIEFRIGIHSGPVVAGVIGNRKFSFDLWGDTVNTASRMESSGVPGAIQVSESTHALLLDRFDFEDRGTIAVKGKGEMRTFLLKGTHARA